MKLSTRGGIAPYWGSANLPEKVLHDMGYCRDIIAISCDMGPLQLPDPLNSIQSPIFTHTPCTSTCLYNASGLHTVEQNWYFYGRGDSSGKIASEIVFKIDALQGRHTGCRIHVRV